MLVQCLTVCRHGFQDKCSMSGTSCFFAPVTASEEGRTETARGLFGTREGNMSFNLNAVHDDENMYDR